MAEFQRLELVDGNVVLKESNELPTRLTREWELKDMAAERRRIRREKSARLRREQVETWRFSCAALVVVLLFLAYVFFSFQVKTREAEVSKLKYQISEIKAENDIEQNRIQSEAENLIAIRDKAIQQLGMVYADENKIRYYNMSDDRDGEEDFIRQYRDCKK